MRTPITVLSVLVVACGGSARPSRVSVQEPETADEAETRPSPPAQASPARCALRATPQPAPHAADALLAVAPQYFHPVHRGGFDGYRDSGSDLPPFESVFPYFEPADLEHPFVPPRGVQVALATSGTFLVFGPDGTLGTIRRGETRLRSTGEQLYPWDAVESSTGEVIATASSDDGPRLVRIAPDGHAQVTPLGLQSAGVGMSADDRPALVFFARTGGRVRLMLSASLDPDDAIEVDHVDLPVAVAELSERTGGDIAVAPDGPHDLAVAWRPLTDTSFTDVGSVSAPPGTPAGAEVRWRTVSPTGALGPLHRHATHARALGGVTGIGPWGLAACGLRASSLEGRALFAWIGDEAIEGARTDDEAATTLASPAGNPLIAFRGSDAARELLLLDSSPRIRAFALRCATP